MHRRHVAAQGPYRTACSSDFDKRGTIRKTSQPIVQSSLRSNHQSEACMRRVDQHVKGKSHNQK
jgi:hypothetical protein